MAGQYKTHWFERFWLTLTTIASVHIILLASIAEASARNSGVVADVTKASFSPDGTLILATIRDGKDQHLHVFSIDGSNHWQLTSGRRFDFSPSFSPDGKEIVFCSANDFGRNDRRRSDIYVVPATGGDTIQVTSTPFSEYRPQYSLTGNKLLFEGNGDIFCFDTEPGLVKNLTSTPEYEAFPMFDAASDGVIFWRARWYGHSSPVGADQWHHFVPHLFDPSSGNEKPLGSKEISTMQFVVTSPRTGSLLVNDIVGYCRLWRISQPDLFTTIAPFDLEYEDSLRIGGVEKKGVRLMFYPSFVPNEERILFVSPEDHSGGTYAKSMDIFTVDITSFEARRVTRLMVNIREPRIAPSGDQVLFLVDPKPLRGRGLCELWLVGLDGNNPHRFAMSK